MMSTQKSTKIERNWIKIAQSTCGSGYKCTNSSNFTSESDYINPCISENTCTGTIQVITEDRNGNPINGTNVYRDGEFRGNTNEFGFVNFNLSKTCQQTLAYNVSCKNNVTVCGQKTTSLETVNDFKSLLFDCSICSGSPDMQIDVDNVRTNKATGNVTVNISLVSSFSATNVNITFKVQDDTGLIARENSQLFNITSGSSFKSITQSITLNENDDFLHVYIDPNNKVTESNEKNNYAIVALFKPQISAYLSISTGYTSIDNEIKDFLKLYVTEEPTQSKANVTIAVGLPNKNSIINLRNWFTKKNYNWWFDNVIYYNSHPLGSKPYNGLVGGFKYDTDGYNYIFVVGNDIDGLLAALKRLISARSLFFSELKKDKVKVIEDTDIAGISVADLLHNPSNKPYYNQRGSDAFANVVSRVLNNNNFEISIKTVQTLNTTSYNQSTILRLKNVNSDFSQSYKDVVVNGSKPVVMSGGIFSTLTTWEGNGKGLARDLVNDGHDVWEIEMNGGDNTECVTCPDYTYQDQVDYYWPVLIAGVMNYSAKNQVHYIGHSNGCRVALSALNSYSNGKNGTGFAFNTVTGLYDLNISLPNRSIDKFFGVACPATLNDETTYTKAARSKFLFTNTNKGDLSININRNLLGKKHLGWDEYARFLVPTIGIDDAVLLSLFIDSDKISMNLMDFYNDLAIDTSSTFNVGNVNVSKLYLFNGFQSDFIVHFDDQSRILNSSNINSQNEEGLPYSSLTHLENHVSIKNNPNVKTDIKKRLKE